MTTLRLFCAVEVSEDLRARVGAYVEGLRGAVPGVPIRWERAEKIHLTLKFFGGVEAERLGDLAEALTAATSSSPPFALTMTGTGSFAARVLWLGVKDEAGELMRLHERVEDECAARGFAREGRAFRPHLTLARLDRTPPAEARRLAKIHTRNEFAATALSVDHVALIKSELLPSGSVHTVLSRHPLRGL